MNIVQIFELLCIIGIAIGLCYTIKDSEKQPKQKNI